MVNPTFTALQSTFSAIYELPYCEGVIDDLLGEHDLTLFYKTGNGASVINFVDAQDDELKALADACEPATFGLNKQDVLDDTYRKAGKMDKSQFATHFSPRDIGILDTVVANLLRGVTTTEGVVAELYKLNVYGPGSFFKPHVDTPRSNDMFGSLVIVLPTVHEGGSLAFRHADQKWEFSSAAMVGNEVKIAYAAFLGDVEHEVLPVTSGYRVTLTYNLYTRARPQVPTALPVKEYPGPGLAAMRQSLSELLKDATFLPEGGFLGFGLSHRYPIGRSDHPTDTEGRLRGSDRIILDVCKELKLDTSVKAVYRPDSDRDTSIHFCLTDNFLDFDYCEEIEDNILSYIVTEMDGTYCRDINSLQLGDKSFDYIDLDEFKTVAWLRPLMHRNTFGTQYLAYGNEASIVSIYGEVCIVAEVPTTANRL